MKLMLKIVAMAAFLLHLTAGSAFASTVGLQWDASPDQSVTGYRVYYSTMNTVPFKGTGAVQGSSPVTVAPAMATVFTVSGLDPTKTYYFAVTAVNAAGQESLYSNIVTILPFPAAPTNVKGVAIQVMQ